jgi:hypothetical protein
MLQPASRFAQFAEQWQDLNRSISNSPLLDSCFVANTLDEFATDEAVVAIHSDRETSNAMAILQRISRFSWQTLQSPNAPIGFWLSRSSADLDRLLGTLAAKLSSQCGMISLTQQDPDIFAQPQSSSRLSTLDYITTARLDFPDSFAEYMQGRSKNFRHNVTRQKNRLGRDGITARLEFLTQPAAMDQAVHDYSRLECASWKAEIDSAVRMDEPQGRFYLKLMRDLAARGEGLVYRYFFNDRLVASDLCIRRGELLIILKTACDETIQGLSTAHLMRIDAFAELVDTHGIRRVEFYGPLKEWHMRLTDKARTMYHINFYRWPLMKRFHELRMARRRKPPETAEVPQSAAASANSSTGV